MMIATSLSDSASRSANLTNTTHGTRRLAGLGFNFNLKSESHQVSLFLFPGYFSLMADFLITSTRGILNDGFRTSSTWC